MVGIGIAVLIACLVLVLGATACYFQAKAERARREQMASVAARLGLHFLPERDAELPRQFRFLDGLAEGSNRYATSTMSGNYNGHPVLLFDYHFTTGGGNHRQAHDISFFMLFLPLPFPELKIGPEGVFSTLAKAFGCGDINFESAEFSRAFHVKSRDKKFAYDVCHPGMMQFLLRNRDLNIEIEGRVLALASERRLNPPEIVFNLTRLLQLRALMPKYLFP
jgi:hypothetical protein